MSREHACHWAFVALLGVAALPAAQSAPFVDKMLGAAASRQDKVATPEPSISERRAEIDKQLVVAQGAVEQARAGKYPIPAGATPAIGNALDPASYRAAVRAGDTIVHLVGTPELIKQRLDDFEGLVNIVPGKDTGER